MSTAGPSRHSEPTSSSYVEPCDGQHHMTTDDSHICLQLEMELLAIIIRSLWGVLFPRKNIGCPPPSSGRERGNAGKNESAELHDEENGTRSAVTC